MKRLIRHPSPALAHMIEKIVFVPPHGVAESPAIQMAADCHFCLGFTLGGSGHIAFAGGASPEPYMVGPTDENELVFVRFRPGVMPRILDGSAAELVGRGAHLEDRIFGEEVDGLCERLSLARTLAAKQQILEGLLLPQSAKPLCQDKRCVRILGMIDALDGQLTVQRISEESGISARSLHRMFMGQVGMSTKQVLRNLRLQRTVDRLRSGAGFSTLGDVAYLCGYADQSHLNKEFQALALQPPSAFLPQRASLLDHWT